MLYVDAVVEEKLQQRIDAHMTHQLPAPQLEDVLTVQQTADLLHVTRQTVYNRVRDGKLIPYKLDPNKQGSTTYFMKSEVLAALKERTLPNGTRKHARQQFSATISKF